MLFLALALVGAGLLATIGVEIGSARPAPAPTVAARANPSAAAPPPAQGDDATDRAGLMQTVLARPLFSATRRPPAAAAVASSAAPEATLPRMTAILIDGDRRSAIFAARAGGKPSVIAEGGHLGPFTVQTIEPQQVTVVGPEGKRTLRTSFDPHPSPPVSTIQPSLAPGSLAPGPLAPGPFAPGPLGGQAPGGLFGQVPAAAPGVAR